MAIKLLDLDIHTTTKLARKNGHRTTNVGLTIDNMDLWSGYTYYTSTGTYRGSRLLMVTTWEDLKTGGGGGAGAVKSIQQSLTTVE